MSLVWISLIILTVVGAVFATVLASLEHWIAFLFFLVVFVIGVTALTVQVVLTS